MYNTIIFDIDGTLLDTEKAVLGALQKLLKEDYNKEYAIEDLYFTFGIPGSRALPQLGVTDIDRALERWIYYIKEFFHHIEVYRGVKEVLEALNDRNILQGIVTSKTREEFEHDFVPFGLDKYMSYVVTADDTEKHKPNPEPILKFLELSGADPKKSIYIGDTIYDYACARDAGVDFGLATWGCRDDEGIHATHNLKTPLDIIKLLD